MDNNVTHISWYESLRVYNYVHVGNNMYLLNVKKHLMIFEFTEDSVAVVIDEEADQEPGEEEDTHEAMGPPTVAGTSSDGVREAEEAEEALGDDGVNNTNLLEMHF